MGHLSGAEAEFFFWPSLDFWDEKEEIRDKFKVRTFFWSAQYSKQEATGL